MRLGISEFAENFKVWIKHCVYPGYKTKDKKHPCNYSNSICFRTFIGGMKWGWIH